MAYPDSNTGVFSVVCLLILCTLPGWGQQPKAEWTWKDRNGAVRTRSELDEMLHKHKLWLKQAKDGNRANLSGAYLSGARLNTAKLTDAILSGTVLHGAELNDADLSGADMSGADLSGAFLYSARLQSTNLHGAELNDADLSGADMSGAKLFGADLSNAILKETNLKYSIFEPITLPNIADIALAANLEFLTYDNIPTALVELRQEFQSSGFLEQGRMITYAVERRETERLWEKPCKERRLKCADSWFRWAFFDLTNQYGMKVGRPLGIGFFLWIAFSFVYFGFFVHRRGPSGLYLTATWFSRSGEHTRVIQIQPKPITQQRRGKRLTRVLRREWRLLRASMFFSMMSAFNIGFRDINVGNWLRMLTKREYDIKAVGWARTVAGFQSLISVYLIALWILTYFGRPFE